MLRPVSRQVHPFTGASWEALEEVEEDGGGEEEEGTLAKGVSVTKDTICEATMSRLLVTELPGRS